MAVTNGSISRTMYIGLSADVKPVAGVEFSAQFYEYDTGKTYIWTGQSMQSPTAQPPNAGQWVEYLPAYPADFYNLTDNPAS